MPKIIVPLATGKRATFDLERLLYREDALALAEALAALAPAIAETGPQDPTRKAFTAAHLRTAYLLAESQGSTDTQLVRRWAAKSARKGDLAWPLISDAGLRSRRAELAHWGLVEWSGGWGRTLANRPSKIWQLISLDRELLEGFDPVPPLDEDARKVLPALAAEAGSDVILATLLADLRRYTMPAVTA